MNKLESGEAHVPPAMMVRYADYFDVSLDYIFGPTDNRPEFQNMIKDSGKKLFDADVRRKCDFSK